MKTKNNCGSACNYASEQMRSLSVMWSEKEAATCMSTCYYEPTSLSHLVWLVMVGGRHDMSHARCTNKKLQNYFPQSIIIQISSYILYTHHSVCALYIKAKIS